MNRSLKGFARMLCTACGIPDDDPRMFITDVTLGGLVGRPKQLMDQMKDRWPNHLMRDNPTLEKIAKVLKLDLATLQAKIPGKVRKIKGLNNPNMFFRDKREKCKWRLKYVAELVAEKVGFAINLNRIYRIEIGIFPKTKANLAVVAALEEIYKCQAPDELKTVMGVNTRRGTPWRLDIVSEIRPTGLARYVTEKRLSHEPSLTQLQLALLAGVKLHEVSAIELGKEPKSPEARFKRAQVLFKLENVLGAFPDEYIEYYPWIKEMRDNISIAV